MFAGVTDPRRLESRNIMIVRHGYVNFPLPCSLLKLKNNCVSHVVVLKVYSAPDVETNDFRQFIDGPSFVCLPA